MCTPRSPPCRLKRPEFTDPPEDRMPATRLPPPPVIRSPMCCNSSPERKQSPQAASPPTRQGRVEIARFGRWWCCDDALDSDVLSP